MDEKDYINKRYREIIEKWQERTNGSHDNRLAILDSFHIIFAYNSNKIENQETTYHDTREIFENGKVINFTGDIRTLFEIQNQKKCVPVIEKYLSENAVITKEMILNVHKVLMDGCYSEDRFIKGERPRSFKKHDYGVGDDIGVMPEDVETEIEFICRELKENEGKDPLKIASYFHLAFESIHPFADGNGRTGRTLMNYYLIAHDYPPVVVYEEDKAAYYMALSLFDKTDKLDGMELFLKSETIKTWEKRFLENRRFSGEEYGL